MLEEMTPEIFMEWRAYSLIEPFEDVRNDYRIAGVVKALWDINRDSKKHPQPFNVEDFIFRFKMGFEKNVAVGSAPTRNQTPQERTRNLKLWALAFAPKPPPAPVPAT
jgi:hypothetical protein